MVSGNIREIPGFLGVSLNWPLGLVDGFSDVQSGVWRLSTMASNHSNEIATRNSSARSSDGLGSVLLAAAAAVGAGAVVLQLGGCASNAVDDSSVAAGAEVEAVAWDAPNYRPGWYETETSFDQTPEAGQEFVSDPGFTAFDASGLGDTTAVRVSLFPDFDPDSGPVDPEGFTSGDTNLTQVSFAAEGADFDPDLSTSGDWMVFASTQHHERPDLYRKSVDGRVVTQLTSDPAQDLMPEISPDGRRIAFSSDRHGNWDVFVMSADGGPVTQITFDDAQELHPTWSPDGKKLCYCRFNERTRDLELWTLSIDKPSARSFVCEGMFPCWSPDSSENRILFQRSRKRGDRLYGVWTIDLVNGDGVNPTEIVAAGDAAIMHPSWSPDGRRIAYTVVSDPSVAVDGMPVESDIWTIGTDGTGRMALTSGGYRNLRPNWGGDDRVYFMSNRGGLDVIWAVSGGSESAFGEAVASDEKSDLPYEDFSSATPATAVAGVEDQD